MKNFALSAFVSVMAAGFGGRALSQDGLYAQELDAISMNESSGGLNMNHEEIKKGPFKGTRAGGEFGLLPQTAQQLVGENPSLQRKYGHILVFSTNQVTEELTRNAQMSRDIALVFWKQLRIRFDFTPSEAAYAWLHGPGAVPKTSQEDIQQDEYVQKFVNTLYWKHQNAKTKSKKR